MLWSILISGIPERYHSVQPLLHSLLEVQGVARRPDIELVYLMDNKRRPVGAKRNALLSLAKSVYITFVDDDDEVAPSYVDRIYNTISRMRKTTDPPDVICFPQRATILPFGVIHECTYSLAHYRTREKGSRRVLEQIRDEKGNLAPNVMRWTGPPAHTMCWRREIVKDVLFDERNFGEDTEWVDACCEKAENEVILEGEPLYFYKFDEETSATR